MPTTTYVHAAVVREEDALLAENLAFTAEHEGCLSAATWLRSYATRLRTMASFDRREIERGLTPTTKRQRWQNDPMPKPPKSPPPVAVYPPIRPPGAPLPVERPRFNAPPLIRPPSAPPPAATPPVRSSAPPPAAKPQGDRLTGQPAATSPSNVQRASEASGAYKTTGPSGGAILGPPLSGPTECTLCGAWWNVPPRNARCTSCDSPDLREISRDVYIRCITMPNSPSNPGDAPSPSPSVPPTPVAFPPSPPANLPPLTSISRTEAAAWFIVVITALLLAAYFSGCRATRDGWPDEAPAYNEPSHRVRIVASDPDHTMHIGPCIRAEAVLCDTDAPSTGSILVRTGGRLLLCAIAR